MRNLNAISIIKRHMFSSRAFKAEECDFAVIGGGSGGLSFAYEAAQQGFSVKLFDYVEATPLNNKWGIGGTCANVGCIPKKLYHTAAIHKANIKYAELFGFTNTDKLGKVIRPQLRNSHREHQEHDQRKQL